MTEPAPRPRFGFLERIRKHPLISVVVAVVGFVAVVIGGLDDSLDLFERLGPPATSSPQAPPPSSAVTPGAEVTGGSARPTTPRVGASPATSAAAPACRTSGWAVVACDEEHSFEQIEGACDDVGVLRFMGGVVGRDVSSARGEEKDGRCWINLASPRRGSVRDALAGPGAAAALRQCVDERSARFVPCNQRHSGEYLATGETSRAPSDQCGSKASDYMARQLGDVDEVLAVRPVSRPSASPAAARCVIEARGQRRLTTSVFGLGTGAVPVEG